MVSGSMFDFLKAMLGSNNVKNNHSRGFVLFVLTTSISICDTQLWHWSIPMFELDDMELMDHVP